MKIYNNYKKKKKKKNNVQINTKKLTSALPE